MGRGAWGVGRGAWGECYCTGAAFHDTFQYAQQELRAKRLCERHQYQRGEQTWSCLPRASATTGTEAIVPNTRWSEIRLADQRTGSPRLQGEITSSPGGSTGANIISAVRYRDRPDFAVERAGNGGQIKMNTNADRKGLPAGEAPVRAGHAILRVGTALPVLFERGARSSAAAPWTIKCDRSGISRGRVASASRSSKSASPNPRSAQPSSRLHRVLRTTP